MELSVKTRTHKIGGGVSLITIIVLIIMIVAGLYAYVDYQADLQANKSMMAMVDDAKMQGVVLSYDTVDSSPLTRSVTVSNFKIKSNEQEPDIILGKLVISGLDWQAFSTKKKDHLPLSMSIDITDGKIILDDNMIENDPNLQSFVDVMGKELHFSIHASYSLDEKTGVLTALIQQSVNDNFRIKADMALGNTGWLAYVKTDESVLSDDLTLDLLATTLNNFSITFNNTGLIEKLRAVASKQSGLSEKRLIQQAVTQLRQIQSEFHNYSPVYSLMIEEIIKFTQRPNQLLISIDPEQPLTSDDFLKVFIGKQSNPFDLMKKAQLFIRAN